MMLAVKMRSIEVVRILKLKSLRIAMRCGYTALMECCKNGYSEMICHLISEAGMQTGNDFQWGAGCTALMIACYYGHSDCVRQLLDIEGKIYTPREFGPETSAQAQSFLILLEAYSWWAVSLSVGATFPIILDAYKVACMSLKRIYFCKQITSPTVTTVHQLY